MIQIICVSDSNKHFEQAIKEYEKRLSKEIRLITIKPSKKGEKNIIIKKDTENINKILSKQKNSYNILLSLSGLHLDSIKFSNIIEGKLNQGINVNFIIGGAFGLDENKLVNIDFKISLSKFTFPHGLALLVLLEQLYRSFQIIKGKSYHY